jgi:serine/threonine protein kinase
MAISSNDVWSRLIAEGVTTESQCQLWREELSPNMRQEDLQDGLRLLKKLLDQGVLTSYQARILAERSDDPLSFGSWLILGPVSGKVWRDWVIVRKALTAPKEDSTKDQNSHHGSRLFWARWLNADWVNRMGGVKTIVARGKCLHQTNSNLVQRSEVPVIDKNRLLLRVEPLSGLSLAHWMAEKPLDLNRILQVVYDSASALATFHENKLIHGRVAPDRIYWHDQHGLTLACEPTVPSQSAQTKDGSNLGLLLREDLGELPREAWVAPELSTGNGEASMSTDVFSLGATCWWLLTGKAPMPGSSQSEHLQQATQHLSMDNKASKTALAYLKCLQGCLQAEPASRFSDAIQLLRAIEASATEMTIGRSSPTLDTSSSPQSVSQRTHVTLPSSPAVSTSIQLEQLKPRSSKAKLAKKRRRGIPWWMPPTIGCVFMGVAMTLLLWSGALAPSDLGSQSMTGKPTQQGNAATEQPPDVRDPLLQHFRLVDQPDVLWAPPSPPNPLELNLLPAGPQWVVAVRPSSLLRQPNMATLLNLARKSNPLEEWLNNLFRVTGLAAEEILQLTVALYSPAIDMPPEGSEQSLASNTTFSSFPDMVMRVELTSDCELSRLKSLWGVHQDRTVDHRGVLVLDPQHAVYLPQVGNAKTTPEQPVSTSVSPDFGNRVRLFSIGRPELIQEVADLEGSAGPLDTHMKRLLERSNREYDFCLLAAPRFLFTEGKNMVLSLPPGMQVGLEGILGRTGRAILAQSHSVDRWYWEFQMIGATDSDTARIVENWKNRLSQAGNQAEAWLLEDRPHPYWRGLAVRLPQMLSLWRQYTRFGVEDGIALTNGYLPTEASTNLLAAAWISMQAGALQPSADSGSSPQVPVDSSKAMDVEEFLNRPIRFSFEQEPIEKALALIGEEANDGLPQGQPPVRFELDGTAFEKAGITRNQQIRQFRSDGESVRWALTELAKRGNPTTNVTDLREARQQLVWVVRDAPQQAGQKLLWLTTRSTAVESGWALPAEFSPATD